ncbi:hypothetical protein [Pseudofrankia asymbiotica]|uniref:hypothetical protein n=1 Tax=Pseudofrankia asymbiotica TaxID=1834516 RepID=UPI001F5180C3|nr:hypothetical protein [Pseudofrankia asymbiotica]
MDGSLDESVPFEAADGLGEHLLADAVDGSAQFLEPQRAALQCVEHEQAPLVADAVDDLPGRAGGGEDVVASVG